MQNLALSSLRQRPRRCSITLRRKAFGPPWNQQLSLADGRELILRPISPLDAEPLRAGFALLTPEEVRFRFLHPIREMTPEMAHKLTHLDPKREFALVAAEPLPAGEALVGAVVRASINEDGRRAEFAILVSHLLARQGLGTLLLKRVIRWAKLKRLDELYGDVLDENTAMLSLAQSLGFHRESLPHDPGLVRVSLPLQR